MVRYPKKTDKLYFLTEVKPHHVPAKQLDIPKVEELNEHIRALEAKIKAIESNVIKNEVPDVTIARNKLSPGILLKKYWIPAFILGVMMFAFISYMRWLHPRYVGTTGFYVNAPDVKVAGLDIVIPKTALEKMLIAETTIGAAWVHAAHWPSFLEKQGWLLRSIGYMYQKRITIDRHPGETGFVVNVMENNVDTARIFAASVVNEFKAKYVAERKSKIQNALHNIDDQNADHRKRLDKIMAQLALYKTPEQTIIVSSNTKKSLDNIVTVAAVELQQEYARLKDQIQVLPVKEIKDSKVFDRLIFYGLVLRLTNMELKKYLLNPDDAMSYEGGLAPTKSKIVAMINAYAATDKNFDVNLFIKSVFLRAKFDALDVLINKRYGNLSSFSGRMSEHAGLEAEFEKRYTSIENAYIIKEQLKRFLQRDQSTEVVVDMPAIVVKK